MSGNEIRQARAGEHRPLAVRVFSPDVRREIDSLALQLPPEAVAGQARETFRDLRSWLTQRAPMPLKDEVESIRATHARVLAALKRVDSNKRVAETLARLVRFLPASAKPEAGEFGLFVLDSNAPLSAPGGQGFLYMSSHTLQEAMRSNGDDQIAFLLAWQLAGSGLKHCRAWYQAELSLIHI